MKTRFYIPLLALALTACSNDELTNSLMREYPLVIEATGLQAVATPASTRATVDGNWDGVTSVALSVGGMVKEYSVTTTDTEKKTATLSRNSDPFWWTSRNPITVSAWWPYATTMPDVVVKSDQRKQTDFAASDFISAEAQTVQFGNPTLEFSHRTARIRLCSQRLHLRRSPDRAVRQPDFGVQPPHGAYNG